MKPNYYAIIQNCVINGVSNGLRDAHKYDENPDQDVIEDHIVRWVLNSLCEMISFDEPTDEY